MGKLLDAYKERQLKIVILKWLNTMREAATYSDLVTGRHIIKQIDGTAYFFFKSIPLFDYLKKEYEGFAIYNLWDYIVKWGGRKQMIRIKHPTGGSMPVDLWGIPISFADEESEEELERELEKEKAMAIFEAEMIIKQANEDK